MLTVGLNSKIWNQQGSNIVTRKPQLDTPALIHTCHELANAATEVILPFFRQNLPIENKSETSALDPVTEADVSAERQMRKILSASWPEHGVIGEELANTNPDAAIKWVLDPIDGTRSFILGYPTWGTLIGVTQNAKPIAGMMAQPYTGERFWADENQSYMRAGANAADQILKTRPCTNLSDAILTTTHPIHFPEKAEFETFEHIASQVRMMRYGGDCYQYCMLAAGLIDVVIESGLAPYDITALIPIVERAGGRITTWSGGPAQNGGQIVAVGDPALHEPVLDKLKAVAKTQ